MATLNPTESARVCGILDEAIEKLSFLAHLTPAAKLEKRRGTQKLLEAFHAAGYSLAVNLDRKNVVK